MKKLLLLLLAFTVISCTDATRSKISGLGNQFKIEVVNCDGSVTHSWISTGKVISENHSDGYYFEDSKTGKLVEVTGNLIITPVQ